QLSEVCLCMALVAPLEIIRERDVAQQALGDLIFQTELRFAPVTPDGIHHAGSHIIEGLGSTCTAIEDARDFRVVNEVQIDFDHIIHVDEVPHLSTITITVPAPEQTHMPFLLELVEVVKSNGSHPALMLFL